MNARVGRELGHLTTSGADAALRRGRADVASLGARSSRAVAATMSADIAGVANDLRRLRAELHRAPPKEVESGYEIEDDAQDDETRFYKLPFGQARLLRFRRAPRSTKCARASVTHYACHLIKPNEKSA